MATIVLRSAGTQLKNNVIDSNFTNINNEVIAATAAIIVNAADIATNVTNIANKIDKTTGTAQAIASTLQVNADILFASGSITSAGGAISFGNETVCTTGTLKVTGTGSIGTTSTNLGTLHVDQSSASAAIATLVLGQDDVSEEMIQFISTVGTGNTLEAAAAKTLTVTHFIRVNINATPYYLQAGTIA